MEQQKPDWRLADPRHDGELWAFKYGLYRYLERVSDSELDRRYCGIASNMDHLVCALRDPVPLLGHFISSWWWLKVKFQTEREYSLRGRALPATVPVQTDDRRPIPCEPKFPNECGFVVRYGEAKWLEPMLKEGLLRVRPASHYKGEVTVYDMARHDDELNSHSYVPGNRVTVKTPEEKVIPVDGNLRESVHMPDYYVFCCSHEFDYRLFDAFRNEKGEAADACLVINDTEEFARRLNMAMQEKLGGWDFYHNPVMYFDPHNVLRDQKIIPGAFKDFRYAYQREYRFLWSPEFLDPLHTYGTIELRVGPLEDIASLHYATEGRQK